MTLSYMAFVVFFLNQYEPCLIVFESGRPLIHSLFHGMSSLLATILQSIASKLCLYASSEGPSKMFKPISNLAMIDFHEKEN